MFIIFKVLKIILSIIITHKLPIINWLSKGLLTEKIKVFIKVIVPSFPSLSSPSLSEDVSLLFSYSETHSESAIFSRASYSQANNTHFRFFLLNISFQNFEFLSFPNQRSQKTFHIHYSHICSILQTSVCVMCYTTHLND